MAQKERSRTPVCKTGMRRKMDNRCMITQGAEYQISVHLSTEVSADG